MKVHDIFSHDVKSCGRDSTLAEAAAVMGEADSGLVPVVDAGGRLAGVITDRDICMAVARRNLRAADARVGDVMTAKVLACRPDDPIREALKTMREGRVRRLPVVDADGKLLGILALNDVARAAPHPQGPSTAAIVQDLMVTLMAIGDPHRQPAGAR